MKHFIIPKNFIVAVRNYLNIKIQYVIIIRFVLQTPVDHVSSVTEHRDSVAVVAERRDSVSSHSTSSSSNVSVDYNTRIQDPRGIASRNLLRKCLILTFHSVEISSHKKKE